MCRPRDFAHQKGFFNSGRGRIGGRNQTQLAAEGEAPAQYVYQTKADVAIFGSGKDSLPT